MGLTDKQLVSRFITCDYKGMADQKTCAIELLHRIQTSQLTIEEAITLIKETK